MAKSNEHKVAAANKHRSAATTYDPLVSNLFASSVSAVDQVAHFCERCLLPVS